MFVPFIKPFGSMSSQLLNILSFLDDVVIIDVRSFRFICVIIVRIFPPSSVFIVCDVMFL